MKVLSVFGTRPEAIKMAPISLVSKQFNEIEHKVCVTAQHREMLDSVLNFFEITADYDLNIMKKGQDLFDITSRALLGLREVYRDYKPDVVLVHGDTSTSFVAALAAFYEQIKVGHVEAGLRTWNKFEPFPEELNRQLTGRLADFHFAPTQISLENLLKENVPVENVFVTGNTVIDALLWASNKVTKKTYSITPIFEETEKTILITCHRRENLGAPLESICKAIKLLGNRYPDISFLFPVHLNPKVQITVKSILGNMKNIHLIDPLDYEEFVYAMNKSYLILTDSGGVQEEGPSLGKPVLVMRNVTERPEAVDVGTVKLVGSNEQIIIEMVSKLIENRDLYNEMSSKENPYGDGTAAKKILNVIGK